MKVSSSLLKNSVQAAQTKLSEARRANFAYG